MELGLRFARSKLATPSPPPPPRQAVTCPRGLHRARAKPSIAAIRLLPSGHWNFSREKWPGQVVVTRAVSLTGVPDEGGHPLYGKRGPRLPGQMAAAGCVQVRALRRRSHERRMCHLHRKRTALQRRHWVELLAPSGGPHLAGSPACHAAPAVDANRLTELVVVGANGSLLLSTLFLDDCLLPAMPLLCLAVAADNGNLTMRQLVLGDASCTDISHSTATDWLLKVVEAQGVAWAGWASRLSQRLAALAPGHP